MLIGQDFDKIELSLMGLDLVEPNAFIGDTVILIVALFFAYKTKHLNSVHPFFNYWKWFFIIFGVGFFFGGLGHLLFNYFGVPGKYLSWYSGIFASFMVEKAMISVHNNQKFKTTLGIIINIKLGLALIAATLVFVFVDLEKDPGIGLRVPTLNTLVGLLFALGYLGLYYSKTITRKFNYFWISIIILLPTAVFQSMKISFHQWFDRNDASHILLIIGLILYFQGIKGYNRYLSLKN